jgi:hypothetical protein
MDIYSYKSQLESLVKPAPDQTLVNARLAWEFIKPSLLEAIDGENYEELGFSISLASYFEGKTLLINEDQFEFYIGRLIDADPGINWRTAEINFYYFYEMNPELRSLLNGDQNPDIDVAYNTTDGKEEIYKRVDTFIGFVDSKQAVLEILRDLVPVRSSYSLWLT